MFEKSQTTTEMFREFVTRTRLSYGLMYEAKPGGQYAGMKFQEQIDIDVMYRFNESKRRRLYETLVERGIPKSRLNRAVRRYHQRALRLAEGV